MTCAKFTQDVEMAAARLREGGVVAFPTETVYGFGANATNVAADGALRRADALGAGRLLIEAPPESEDWLAIHDRLTRAAAGSAPNAP